MLKPSQLYEFLVKMICCHVKNLFFNLKIQYFEAKPEVIFLKKWNEMDNFPIFNNDIKVSEDVPTLYFNFKMQVRTRNQSARNSNSTSIFSKSKISTDSIFEKPGTMDSNKSKKVDHEPLAEINDLVNDDIELKHEEKDSNNAESIDENYNSGFLRRPQNLTKSQN